MNVADLGLFEQNVFRIVEGEKLRGSGSHHGDEDGAAGHDNH